MNEFEWSSKQPYRGLTSIEAAAFLKHEFPDVPQWMCWMNGTQPLKHIVGKNSPSCGTIGSWSWKRVACSYPSVAYWEGDATGLLEEDETHPPGIKDTPSANSPVLSRGDAWAGVIEVAGDKGERFMLFSFLNARGELDRSYYASSVDLRLLTRFARDVDRHFRAPLSKTILIDVTGGRDITIKAADSEQVFLPQDVLQDIEQQTFSFFKNRAAYRKMRLRHRRGFLFVGDPGTGKTMMIRHLIRQSYRQFCPSFYMLSIRKNTDQNDVTSVFQRASRNAPAMIILEDLDSLTTESTITRSAFLTILDGLSDHDGVLVIGTTNHPGRIDPALVHRPSRFDRVWHFPLPDYELRQNYLESFFTAVEGDVVRKLARETKNWSFAYLKELHTTASIMAIENNQPHVDAETALKAFDMLDRQYQDGKKNHVVRSEESTVGFAAA